MDKNRRELFPPYLRRRLYLITSALIPLLVAYGYISNTHAPLWLALANAALIAPLAAVYTPKEKVND